MSGGSQSEGASNSASPASSIALSNPSSSQGINNNAPKYGTLVPNRIFVGGISSNTTEAELCQLFSKYGNVKATKIIADRAGVSKGYGFVTFESEEEVKFLTQDANNIVLKERRLNIAPAIKKQPPSRSFDTSSPPPTTPNLYFHNGVPYTFHNGMAFFPPTAHQPTLAALPPSEPSIYPSYGHTQNSAPAPYGTPMLVPAPPPIFMPQNYSYQPLPMTNGAPTQLMYPGSGSSPTSPGSPTPDPSHLPPPLPPQFYAQQFAHQDYYQPVFVTSHIVYNQLPEYDMQDQLTINDDCSSTVSTPHSDLSERSSSRSPSNLPVRSQFEINKHNQTGLSTANNNSLPPQSHDSQVPVVSWQALKIHGEERELQIRDGRRAFHPIIPPPPPQPQMLLYPSYPSTNTVYQPQQKLGHDPSRGQRQSLRGRPRYIGNNMPFIPKFPASFNNNNNNPLTMNNNFHEKKPADLNNGRSPRFFANNRSRGGGRGSRPVSPHLVSPNPTNSYPSSSVPQMLPPGQFTVDRVHPAPRWVPNPPIAPHQIKRLVYNKKQNGPSPTMSLMSTSGSVRVTKKSQGVVEGDGDVGGGGDAQQLLPDLADKEQTLSHGSS